MKSFSEKVRKKVKSTKREVTFVDIALLILGILMIIFPEQSGDIICIFIGVILGIWGLVRLITYFASGKVESFGSFALVQGAALLGFGILFIINPGMLKAFLSAALAIILIVSGVMKLQYAVDFLRLKAKFWYISLLGAIISITLGAIVFFNPFTTAKWLMLFIGISLVVNALWDLASVAILSKIAKNFAAKDDDMIEVESSDAVDTDI